MSNVAEEEHEFKDASINKYKRDANTCMFHKK